jgi:hypothetical protein
MRFIIPCNHCGKENIVPLVSTTNICSECREPFHVQLPAGLMIAQRIFDYLRNTPKGEARSNQLEKALGLSREELGRGRKYLIENRVIEGTIEDPPKNYRFTRRYLRGHNKTPKAPITYDVGWNDPELHSAAVGDTYQFETFKEKKVVAFENAITEEGPDYSQRVKDEQEKILEKQPLVTKSYQHQMPIVFEWTWTENEGDMTKPHIVHKTTLHPSIPDVTK